MMLTSPPLLGITAYSGTGKTTLLKMLIPLLRQRGIRIALIKHSHHDVDVDTPGKDSYELRKAGADQTIVVCQNRWALMTETPQQPADFYFLANQFSTKTTDLILVEGFKHEPINKIALYRTIIGKSLNSLIDQHVIALATDQPVHSSIPVLDINQPAMIANFIMDWLKKPSQTDQSRHDYVGYSL